MDEDNNNPIIKNTGDINIDTRTYFQKETQNITQNGDYIYEQNENGAWHLESKPQDSTEPTDVKINISIPTLEISKYFKLYNEVNGEVTNYYELNYVQNPTTYTLNDGYSYLIIVSRNDFTKNGKAFYFLVKYSTRSSVSNAITFNDNHWVCIIAPNTITQNSDYIRVLLYKNNNTNQPNEIVLNIRDIDEGGYDNWTYCFISDDIRTINIV